MWNPSASFLARRPKTRPEAMQFCISLFALNIQFKCLLSNLMPLSYMSWFANTLISLLFNRWFPGLLCHGEQCCCCLEFEFTRLLETKIPHLLWPPSPPLPTRWGCTRTCAFPVLWGLGFGQSAQDPDVREQDHALGAFELSSRSPEALCAPQGDLGLHGLQDHHVGIHVGNADAHVLPEAPGKAACITTLRSSASKQS